MSTDVTIADDAHTYEERRLGPGVYPSAIRGHALLVGTNQRSLTVVDLGGVIQVAGIDVTDPDHLGTFADHLRHVAGRLRNRQSTRPEPTSSSVEVTDLLSLIEDKP